MAAHPPIVDRLISEVLRAADPARAVARAWPSVMEGNRPVTLIGFGKASAAMASAAIDRLGGRIAAGLVVGVPEQVQGFDPRGTPVRALAADHPLPTDRNLRAADAIEELARAIDPRSTVLVLISGGASAQLTAPAAGLSLHDIRATTDALLRAGASIDELNAVRKHLDRLKGGRLAAMLAPARVIGLVVSDVMGDRLDVVSSGPTAPDPSTYADALTVLATRRVPASDAVVAHLRAGARGEHAETPKPGDPVFARVTHRVIANNQLAVDAARVLLERDGYRVRTRSGVTGEASDVGRALGACLRDAAPGEAFVWGGETTVNVGSAPGLGGRNQELALAAARTIGGEGDAVVLSFGTDGIDGPTDAAGGVVTGQTASKLQAARVDPADALARHDSHRALDAVGGLIRIGPTGTNVNDVMVGIRLLAR